MKEEVMILKGTIVESDLAALARAMDALRCKRANLVLQVDKDYKVQAFVVENPETKKFVRMRQMAFRLQVDFRTIGDGG